MVYDDAEEFQQEAEREATGQMAQLPPHEDEDDEAREELRALVRRRRDPPPEEPDLPEPLDVTPMSLTRGLQELAGKSYLSNCPVYVLTQRNFQTCSTTTSSVWRGHSTG